MANTKENNNGEQQPTAVYFKSLTIRDVKCFKGEHTIDLSDGGGRPAQWTVILGNNNTGKTTLLKCITGLEVVKQDETIHFPKDITDWNLTSKYFIKSELIRKGVKTKKVSSGNYRPYLGLWEIGHSEIKKPFKYKNLVKNKSRQITELGFSYKNV